MNATTVGILHPGQMGAALATQLRRNGVTVLWCPIGRSDATQQRAETAGLSAVVDLAALLEQAQVLVSICPPAAAENLAQRVARLDYQGIFVEANAISPARMHRIAVALGRAGASVVDGVIIGPPPTDTAHARLYLAGDDADRVTALFTGTTVESVDLRQPVGAASGLKMAYAGYQKAARTLAAIAHALADHHHVTDHLVAEALRNPSPPLADLDYLPSVAARAWRWAPEMLEVGDALTEAGLPPNLAVAAGQVLQRWNSAKGTDLPLSEVFARLHG